MGVRAKVCDLTADLLWFVCGLYVGILTSSLKGWTQPWNSTVRFFNKVTEIKLLFSSIYTLFNKNEGI